MNLANEQLWLVKSSGRILGPFTKAEISDLLSTREIVVLDEVAPPARRWQYIRDDAQFAKEVEELRQQHLNEKTDDTTADITTNTASVTAPLDYVSDDLTEDVFDLSQMNEVVYENVEETREEPPRPGAGQEQYKSYGFYNDPAVRKQAQKSTRVMWILTVVIIVAVVGFVGYKQYVVGPQQQRKISSDYIAEGKEALSVGKYHDALEAFKKANTLSPNNTGVYTFLGPLLIQLEGQTVMGKRMLTMALETEDAYQLQAWTGIGLAELIDGELSRAEQAFDRALQLDPTYFPALINLGVIAQKRGDYRQAKNYLRAAIDKGSSEGEAFLLLAQSQIHEAENENDPEYLSQAQRVIQDYLHTSYDYLQEAKFISAYIDFLNKDFHRAELKVNNLLDIDPELTSDHYHTIFTNKDLVSWSHFLGWCKQMSEGMDASARISSLLALCLLKANKDMEAKKVIDAAVAQEPKDPLIQAVYAHVLESAGLNEESSVALGKATEYDKQGEYRLPVLLQARFCQQQGDMNCAAKYWERLLQLDSASLPAIAGMAQVQFSKKNLSEAQKYLIRGSDLSEQYKPIMQLKSEAESEGLMTFKE